MKEVNRQYFESLVKHVDDLLTQTKEYDYTADNADMLSEAQHLGGYIEVLKDLLAEEVDFEVKKFGDE